MAANKFRVIILKAPSEEGVEQDAYVQLLNSSGFSAIMIPTLEFRYKNLDLLSDCLRRPHEYSGIIVNSPRCARALIECFKIISDVELLTQWKKLKCFVVGNATGSLLSDSLNFTHEGSDSGNLSNLLALIAGDAFEKPFLMPVGSLHKNQDDKVEIRKVEVYETIEHPRLKENLCDIFDNNEMPLLVTFFSPSGVTSALPYIKQYPNKALKFIALGPTSARELESCHLKVDGVCAKPSPESLIDVIVKMMS